MLTALEYNEQCVIHLQAACKEWRLNPAWEIREVQSLMSPAKQVKTQFGRKYAKIAAENTVTHIR